MFKKLPLVLAGVLALFQAQAQLQLVDLEQLAGVDIQDGKIPVLQTGMESPRDAASGVVSDPLYALGDADNLLAIVDGQLVLMPKNFLAISNGFYPFKNLLNISNGFLHMNTQDTVAVWKGASNRVGVLLFKGFTDLAHLSALAGQAKTLSRADALGEPVYGCVAQQDDEVVDPELLAINAHAAQALLTDKAGGRIQVMIDGVLVDMFVSTLVMMINSGAVRAVVVRCL